MKNIKRNLFRSAKSIAAVTFILFIFNSCTVEKRIYNRGYYVSWHKKNNFSANEKSKTSIEQEVIKSVDFEDVSSQNNTIDQINPTKNLDLSVKEILCDTILLKNGKIISSQIINFNDTLLVYNDCPSNDSKESLLAIKDVKAIKYSNGEIKFFKQQPKVEQKSRKQELKGLKNQKFKVLGKYEKKLVLSRKITHILLVLMSLFILGLIRSGSIFFLAFLIITVILILITLIVRRKILKKAERDPEIVKNSYFEKLKRNNYNSIKFAIFLGILGCILISLIGLFMIFLYSPFSPI